MVRISRTRCFLAAFIVFLSLLGALAVLYERYRYREPVPWKPTKPRHVVREPIRAEKKEETVSPKLVEIYRNQVAGRKAFLNNVQPGTTAYDDLYNVLAPEVFCPGLVRIGRLSDGGKWLCNPQKIPYPCVVYSLGVNNEFSFDSELYAMTKCQLRAIDKNTMAPHTAQFYSGINATLTAATVATETDASASTISFADLVKKHGDSRIDVLKIDIEGGEYDVAEQIAEVPACQILIELHHEPYRMLSLLKTLSWSGFLLFHHEINGGTHKACEFSFIHESCLQDYGIDVFYGQYLT
uniref:Methyltranfer_dom domain-containing protein n=1 Tax=Steinernema glaseri TaxID=37863 RepID=A0A1I7YSS3_9BILA